MHHRHWRREPKYCIYKFVLLLESQKNVVLMIQHDIKTQGLRNMVWNPFHFICSSGMKKFCSEVNGIISCSSKLLSLDLLAYQMLSNNLIILLCTRHENWPSGHK